MIEDVDVNFLDRPALFGCNWYYLLNQKFRSENDYLRILFPPILFTQTIIFPFATS